MRREQDATRRYNQRKSCACALAVVGLGDRLVHTCQIITGECATGLFGRYGRHFSVATNLSDMKECSEKTMAMCPLPCCATVVLRV